MRLASFATLPSLRRIHFSEIFSQLGFARIATSSLLAMSAIIALWLLMVLVVNPIGEFPLNDDWSYARAVKNLAEHGRLELTGFTSMPLISQVIWGALFCLPFGFSFTALRVSTIVLGLLGLIAAFELVKEFKPDRRVAWLAVLVLATSPLYFLLSLTFMTDVPFFTFSMFSFLFLLGALRTENRLYLITGYAFCLVAILIRQLAIIIPLSFLLAYVAKHRIDAKMFVNALIPSDALISLVIAFPFLLRRTIGLPALYNRSFEPIVESITSASMGFLQIPLILGDRLIIELVYVGLFLFPFLISLVMSHRSASSSRTSPWSLFVTFTLSVALLAWLLAQDRMMPLIGNVLFDFGLGSPLLRDTYVLGLSDLPTAPKEFWLGVTIVGVLGAVLLVRHLIPIIACVVKPINFESNIKRVSMVFILSAVILYAGVIAMTGFVDRYLIWLLPLLMCVLVVSRNLQSRFLFLGVVLSMIYGLFAVSGTHDYLAWNRARWQALTDLMEKDHIAFTKIDGGFEFNGWYTYDAAYHSQPSKSWWWVEDDEYVISFGPIPGYVETKQYPFERWIPFGQGNILVLQKIAGASNAN